MSADDRAVRSCTMSTWEGDPKRCRWCDTPLRGRQQRWCSQECADSFGRNHWWTWASPAAKKRDGMACTICGSTERLETDHITPCLGRHSDSGCHHHLDGLRTLCHDCHLTVTAEQFGRAPKVDPNALTLGLGGTP